MTSAAQHELDFFVAETAHGFEFARHGLTLAELVPLSRFVGSAMRITELTDWDHQCEHEEGMSLGHAIRYLRCFDHAYRVAASAEPGAIVLAPDHVATFLAAAGSGLTCTLVAGRPPDEWRIGTHDNHFTTVSGPDDRVLPALVAQGIESFVAQFGDAPAPLSPELAGRIAREFRGLPVVCLAQPDPPPKRGAFGLGRRSAAPTPAPVATETPGGLVIPLAPSARSWVRDRTSPIADEIPPTLALSYDRREARWRLEDLSRTG